MSDHNGTEPPALQVTPGEAAIIHGLRDLAGLIGQAKQVSFEGHQLTFLILKWLVLAAAGQQPPLLPKEAWAAMGMDGPPSGIVMPGFKL